MEPCVFVMIVAVQGHLPWLVVGVDHPATAYPPAEVIPAPVEVTLSDANATDLIKAYRIPGADLCPWIA
jgi:hypothetical protein